MPLTHDQMLNQLNIGVPVTWRGHLISDPASLPTDAEIAANDDVPASSGSTLSPPLLFAGSNGGGPALLTLQGAPDHNTALQEWQISDGTEVGQVSGRGALYVAPTSAGTAGLYSAVTLSLTQAGVGVVGEGVLLDMYLPADGGNSTMVAAIGGVLADFPYPVSDVVIRLTSNTVGEMEGLRVLGTLGLNLPGRSGAAPTPPANTMTLYLDTDDGKAKIVTADGIVHALW